MLADDPKTEEYFTRVLRISKRDGQFSYTIGDMLNKIEKSLEADKTRRQKQATDLSKPEWLERINMW